MYQRSNNKTSRPAGAKVPAGRRLTGWLLAAVLLAAAAGAAAQGHREALVFYVNGGVSFPTGSALEDCRTGLHAGGGFGVPLSSAEPLSVELLIRGEWHRFPERQASPSRYYETSVNCGLLFAAGKFRWQASRYARPYWVVGFGVLDGLNSTTVLGAGIDLAVERNGMHWIFAEVKWINGEYGMDILALGVGIRLG